MTGRPVLELRDVQAGYGDLQVLWGVDIHVDAGELVCLLGPNGSGKSTLMNSISGLIRPRAGEIRFDGTRIGYDFAVSEECGRYDECQRYVDDFGDQVLMIEYRAQDFAETCTAFGATHAVELRDRDLTPSGVHAWC